MSVDTVERWRKKAEFVTLDWDEYSVFTDEYGNQYTRPHMTLTFETVERIREGYLCIQCYEPFERPFPEACNVCKFPCERDQRAWFDREFRGGIDLSPEHSLEEIQELDLGNKGMPNVWLPPGARRN